MIFGTDDIHDLRVELYDRRRNLPKDVAEREFKSRVERGRRAIEEARKNKPANQRVG